MPVINVSCLVSFAKEGEKKTHVGSMCNILAQLIIFRFQVFSVLFLLTLYVSSYRFLSQSTSLSSFSVHSALPLRIWDEWATGCCCVLTPGATSRSPGALFKSFRLQATMKLALSSSLVLFKLFLLSFSAVLIAASPQSTRCGSSLQQFSPFKKKN